MDSRKWSRFSLRLLFCSISFLCVCLASWNVCQQRAISDVKTASGGWTPKIVAPFVLGVERSNNVTVRETYHLFGGLDS
ncbi:MAG: hypothetical protein QF805_17125 [Pirellulaceae bacterium]|nr:hypothetical protein [Pirellulaceae bacterium]